MKKIKYILYITLAICIVYACKKDGADDGKNSDFYPRIFDNAYAFRSPSLIIAEGQSATYSGLTFSPTTNGKTKVSWKVNGQVVSNDTSFVFKPTAGGEYEIKLEANYKGQVATRISKVLVAPNTYKRKPYTNVALAYLSENASAADIDWTTVTHAAFLGASVIPSGTVDFTAGNTNQKLDEIVARGHINGTPVLLGVTGRLSGIDGWSLWNSNDFGTALASPTSRAAVVSALANYVIAKKLDGIDVMLTDLNNESYAVSAANAKTLGPFIGELKLALPAHSIVTATVTTNNMHWEYSDLSVADWINVHAFEDGLTVGPGALRGQSSSLAYMIAAADLWVKTKGYPASKIVLGIPAFGLRYNAIDAAGNNLDWGSFDYIAYKNILGIDALAFDKEMINSSKGIYFNGVPLVSQKANYIKTNGFKGAYLWARDYDVIGGNSLMNAIYTKLK